MADQKIPNMSMGDGFEFIKKMWGGFPIPNAMTPTTDVDELEKRIADLKTVEQWLNLNLNMLRASIQGLEVQRGTLAALRALGATSETHQASAAAMAQESSKAFVENATAWWGMMQDQFGKVAAAAMTSATPAAPTPTPKTEAPQASKPEAPEEKSAAASKKTTTPKSRPRP
jgi:hypothetical protein